MFTNYVQAFYKKNGIIHPDELLIDTFIEVMGEELTIPEWIAQQKQDFLLKVLARAAEKAAAKEAKQTKPKTDKSAVGSQAQPLPPKTEGN